MQASKSRKIKVNYNTGEHLSPWRESLNDIIFGAETQAGKLFDIVLIIAIAISVLSVMLSSVDAIYKEYSKVFWLYVKYSG